MADDDRLTNREYVWNQLKYEHDALIEASAGTGKTYALESIVLKLVQEKEYDATSILLVTFTEKAAGELKDRIRKALVKAKSLPPNFDEMTICTIHSFCRQLLSEYAFENGVPMKSEIGGDSDALVHKAVLEALKSPEFGNLHQDLFLTLSKAKMESIGKYVEVVEKIVRCDGVKRLHDKLFREVDSANAKVVEVYHRLCESKKGNLGEIIHARAEFKKNEPAELYHWLMDAFPYLPKPDGQEFISCLDKFPGNVPEGLWNPKIKSWNGTSTKVGRSEKSLFDIEEISDCKESVGQLFKAIKELKDERNKIKTGSNGTIRRNKVLLNLAELAASRFEKLKKQAALLTFDDMVLRAAEVVARTPRDDGEKLVQQRFFDSIRTRYRVALVDEFQDTDQHQWDIFRTLFSHKVNKVEGEDLKPGFLLVVGDPKQAIYSFRGADVKVYCDARVDLTEDDAKNDKGELEWRKTLKHTFRSKKSLVEAFNIFFRDAPEGGSPADGNEGTGSDWFKDGAAGEGISYEGVAYPEGNEKFAGLTDEGEKDPVLLLESMPSKIEPTSSLKGMHFGNKASCLPEFMHHAAHEMLYLKSLNPAPWARKEHDEEKNTFSYGDMCVLVATNADAAVVRRILAKYGIPYGQYKQQGIYDSPEAEGVLALLDYLSHPSGSGNRVALLLSPIFGVHPSMLSKRSQADDATFDTFIEKLQELATDKDWNKLFERVMSDPCTALANPLSDLCAFNRTRAAVRQIFDALLAERGGVASSVSEFAAVLREWRKNDKAAGDDGPLFKKESEADRVQIMTMHASKGLQFPIVFLAYGFSGLVKPGTPDDEKPAALEERRRLLYVAITRAEYRLYLPWSKRAWNWIGEKEENQKDENGKVIKDTAGKNVTIVRQVACSGIGSAGSALLVGADSGQTTGFLGRAIQVYFEGKHDSAFAPERQLPDKHVESSENGVEHTSPSRQPFEEMSIPGLKSRRFHWDSFTYIPQGGKPPVDQGGERTAEDEKSNLDPEHHNMMVKAKTLLPRNDVTGNVFHGIMEALCKNDPKDVDFTTACNDEMREENSPLMELIRKFMHKYSLVNRKGDGDSADTTTEKVLLRMVQNVLNTSIKIGETEITLKKILKKDRLAEVEFVLDERNLLFDLPRDREGAMNGKIDLLVKIGKTVFVLDWKTNSLPNYEEAAVNEKMDEEGYHLQYKIYSLAAAKWLKPRGLTLGGVAYLFVRGGEVGERSGVFAKAFDETTLEGFRKEISKMGYFAGKKEDA